MTWLIITGLPDLKDTAVSVGTHYAHLGINVHSFALAILASAVITLMTRMQHATENLGVQLVPAILFGALLASGQLFRSVLDSLFTFAGLWSGHRTAISTGSARWLGGAGQYCRPPSG